MTPEHDVERVLQLLRRAIRSSGMSQKEVDRNIGVQPGYLSQVMIGRLDLKMKHLFRALEAIGVDPEGFFELAYSGANEVLPEPAPVDTASQDELDEGQFRRLVARALAEELEELLGVGDDANPSLQRRSEAAGR